MVVIDGTQGQTTGFSSGVAGSSLVATWCRLGENHGSMFEVQKVNLSGWFR